jgi:peptide/nickel transport system substrate-binding protein
MNSKYLTNPRTARPPFSAPLWFLIVIALLLLAACSPAPGADSGATGEGAVAEAPATEGAGEQQGTLRVASLAIVQTDPALISSDSEVMIANQIYDYLVDIASDNSIIPRLAQDWSTSEDGLTWTFTLAEGATFHDGSPVTAEDVVWTYDRLRDPESGFATATLYENIDTIEATSDSEVVFTLEQTNPFFLYDLSDNHALIMKAGTEDPTNFNGSGPFRVVEYVPEDRLILEANPDYFIEGQPKLAGMEIIFFSEQTAYVDALRGGQLDLIISLPTALYESLQQEPGIVTYEVPTNGFDVIRVRSDREPGNNPDVVRAMKMATDREAIFQLIAQGYGEIGLDSPIGPLYTQYFLEDAPVPEYDPEGARALLAEAGYPDGLSITLHVPDTGNRPDLGAVIKDQWEQAGFNVELSIEQEGIYYGEDGWLEVNWGITGWGSRPYPQFYLDVMLTTDAIWNESRYSNPEFDRLVEIAGTTLDEEERTEAYAEIQRILAAEGPLIIPYFFPQFAASSDKVQGFDLKAFGGRSEMRNITLAE